MSPEHTVSTGGVALLRDSLEQSGFYRAVDVREAGRSPYAAATGTRDGAAGESSQGAEPGVRSRTADGSSPDDGARWDKPPERHSVTILFADIVDSTALIGHADAEDAAALIDPVVAAMVAAAERHGGIVSHRGDGIMATFGPPSICEDHALRGCLTALGIGERMAAAGLSDVSIRIGIHSGEVVVGHVPIGGRVVHQVTGAPVHVAARLEQTAPPGTIVMSEAVASRAAPYVMTRPLAPVTVKGVSGEVRRVSLDGLRPVTDRWQARQAATVRPLVGRRRELAALVALLEPGEASRLRVVQVCGPAGIGKSHLLHAFMAEAELRGRPAVRFAGDPHRRHAGFHAIMPWLRDAMGVQDADTGLVASPGAVAASLAAMPGDVADAVETIERVLGIDPATDARPPRLAEEDVHRLQSVVAAILLARLDQGAADQEPHNSGGGLVIVCDDVDQFDVASLALMRAVIARIADRDVLVVAASRSRMRLVTQARARVMPLGPLSDADTKSLLFAIDRRFAESPRLVARITEKAGGNPLFIEEVASLMNQGDSAIGGAARPDGEPFCVKTGDAGGFGDPGIPDRIKSLIADRLAKLSQEQQRLLRFCAVFGLDVRVSPLARLMGLDPGEVSRRLDRLAAESLLVETRRYPDAQFSFRQRMVRDAIYNAMLVGRRREIHVRIVAALEHDGVDDAHLDELVLHTLVAEMREKAIVYLRRAADAAIRRFAYPVGAAHLQRALAIARDLPQTEALRGERLAMTMDLRSLLAALGQYPELVPVLHEARELAETLDRPGTLIRMVINRAHVHSMLGELHEAVDLARRAAALAARLDDPAAQAHAAHFLGQALFNIGELNEADAVLAVAGPTHSESPAEVGFLGSAAALVCGARGLVLATLGRFDAAGRVLMTGHSIAAQTGRPYDAAFVHSVEAFLLVQQDLPVEAEATVARGLEIAQPASLEQLVLPLLVARGHAELARGDPDAAKATLIEALAMARGRRRLMMQIWASGGLALARLSLGELSRAEEAARDAVGDSTRHGFQACEAVSHRVLGLVLLARPKRHSEAVASLRHAASLARRIGMQPEAARARAALAAQGISDRQAAVQAAWWNRRRTRAAEA